MEYDFLLFNSIEQQTVYQPLLITNINNIMKRGKSGELKIRKKPQFRPIILTSKSIKPIHRSNYQRLKHNEKPTIHQLTSKRKTYNFSFPHENPINRSQLIKKLTEQYRDELLKNIKQECNANHSRNKKCKQIAASVIHVQFESQEKQKKYRNKNQINYGIHHCSTQLNQHSNDSIRKYFYSTNSKILQNFINYNKNKMTQLLGFGTSNLIRSQSNKQCNQWNKFVGKMYLNVKKIYPCQKKSVQEKLDNQQPMEEQQIMEVNQIDKQIVDVNLKGNQYPPKLIAKMQYRSKISSSCLDGNFEDRIISPQSKMLEKIPLYTDIQKIQADILTKRQTNKKQHFIFSLADMTKVYPEQSGKQKFEIYKDFLWKVNYSNGLYVCIKDQIEYPYKLYVGPGNNSMLIKGIMKRRFWWQIVDKCNEQVNFVWVQSKINQFFAFQSPNTKQIEKNSINNNNNNSKNNDNDPTNTIPEDNETVLRKVHSATSHWKKPSQQINENNCKTVTNNEKSDQFVSIDIQKFEQLDSNNKIFKGKDYEIWQNHCRNNKKYQQKLQRRPISKRIKTMVKKKPLVFIQQSKYIKIQNHFQCNYYLGNKKALFYSMKKYYTLLNKDPYCYLPLTFHIEKGLDDPQYHKFLQKYQCFQEKKKIKQCQNIWIVKPGEMTNRGRGITVCSILDDIKIRLKSKQRAKNGQIHSYIVQKYIQKPLLYYRRKFDIRHYMLMTCINGKFKGYWYQQGYLRTTSSQYNIKNCKDLYTHLTNDAIQKYSIDYGKYQKGNKVSYTDFQKYLNITYKNKRTTTNKQNKYDFYNSILPKMKNLATDAMKATYMILSPQRYEHNFQLFGLDFMLDEDMNVYLIQVNTNPCLETTCPLLSKIISSVIQNMFKICVDPLFPPPYEWPNQRKMQMGQNALQDNRFILVFDENQHGEQLLKIYQNTQPDENNMLAIDQQDQFYEDEGKQWIEEQK